ncbi:hypothetical protein [Salipiger abyssi]|uniref:hypothetical protein n=1 Tax=Salipiger abyssi TaxID=1250539 RepID=UPI001A8E8C49|nr:hypothetical protein [Salipiger abyssi]MBN9890577.1 hypothetical protein [Salipiger abyssi]
MLAMILILVTGVLSRQSLVLDAHTRALSIEIEDRERLRWDLGRVKTCVPRKTRRLDLPRGEGLCDARIYENSEQDLDIYLHDGVRIDFYNPSEKGVVIVISDHDELGEEFRIWLSRERWIELGTLAFSGQPRIGYPADTNETGLLLAGSYEFRERRPFSVRTDAIKTGTFRRGESIRILEAVGGAAVSVFGTVSPDLAMPDVLAVGLVAGPKKSELEASFISRASPAHISPNWVDRARNSPLILALLSVLSLIFAASQVLAHRH